MRHVSARTEGGEGSKGENSAASGAGGKMTQQAAGRSCHAAATRRAGNGGARRRDAVLALCTGVVSGSSPCGAPVVTMLMRN